MEKILGLKFLRFNLNGNLLQCFMLTQLGQPLKVAAQIDIY